jgi:hypothetical protein
MPFLAKAKNVDAAAIVGEKNKNDQIAGADIAEHLARRGLGIELRRVPAGAIDVADNLLSLAADASADFMVMGDMDIHDCENSSFGGATCGIFAPMTIPILVSHCRNDSAAIDEG